jgi:hypothetical protein
MNQTSNRLVKLHSLLEKSLAGESGVDIRLLGEDQMQIARNLEPNAGFFRRSKSNSQVPGKDGYRIYVAYWTPEHFASVTGTSQRVMGPSARPVTWQASSMKLRLEPASSGSEWTLVNSEGRIVRVTVECGSGRVVKEVNDILSKIEDELLR